MEDFNNVNMFSCSTSTPSASVIKPSFPVGLLPGELEAKSLKCDLCLLISGGICCSGKKCLHITKGNSFLIQESCPHLIEKTVEERHTFLSRHRICLGCLKHKSTSKMTC